VKLFELLSVDRIVLAVPGETVRDAAGPLVQAAITSGRALDPERLEALLADALPGEAVTVGQQAFMLHFRTEAVEGVTAVLGVTVQPVHRLHDPSKEARIVLLLLAPPGEGSAYLRALAAFARALAREDVVEMLERATTPGDVLASPLLAEVEVPAELLVRDILVGRLVTVRPDARLTEAARLLVAHGVPAAPVVSEKNEVLGVISHGEILRYLLPQYAGKLSGEFTAVGHKPKGKLSVLQAREVTVRDAMDRSVLCLSEDQLLADAAALMVNKKLERVPVVREGVLVGLLTREDIVRRLFGP
jgi:CBS domain-containing protein